MKIQFAMQMVLGVLLASGALTAQAQTVPSDLASSANPYQYLESLYNAGIPTQLSEIPTEQQCDQGAHLHELSVLSYVNPMTKAADVTTDDPYYLIRTRNITMVLPGQAPINLDNVLSSSSCSHATVNGTMMQDYSLQETSEGLVESVINMDGKGTNLIKSFRTVPGAIVVKIVVSWLQADGSRKSDTSYNYAWSDKN